MQRRLAVRLPLGGKEMKNVYEAVPVLENRRWRLRQAVEADAYDLLKVYSDPKAVPFFNSDNCHGDNFHYKDLDRMKEAITFWILSYPRQEFVRWSIEDKIKNQVIGTIELFHRDAEDFFTNTGLLRLDLRSDYETKEAVTGLLKLLLPVSYELFDCGQIATKAIPNASERIQALTGFGFQRADQCLIGHDGTPYNFYYVLKK